MGALGGVVARPARTAAARVTARLQRLNASFTGCACEVSLRV
jgi:hypothetical protein